MKRFLYFLLSVAFVSTIATGCQEEELSYSPTVETEDHGHFVSLEQALIKFQPTYNEAAGVTRSKSLPLISNVERFGGSNDTRSNEEFAPYYIVNFADDAGFAVLSADNRLLPVYAFSASGSIELSDTLRLPALSYFFNSLLINEVNNITLLDSSIITPILPDPSKPYPEKPYEKVEITVSPLLTGNVPIWSQGEPFNIYCTDPTSVYTRYQVGCAALSISQICAYNEKPKTFKVVEELKNTTKKDTIEYHLNWPLIRAANILPGNKYIDTLAHFLKYLGDSEHLNMDYGVKESSSLADSIEPTLKKIGFSTAKQKKYGVQTIDMYLKAKRPIIVAGVWGSYVIQGDSVKFKQSNGDGHVFVIDGIATTIYAGEIGYLVHCVWGMGKKAPNGFFYNPSYSPYTNVLPPTAEQLDNPDYQYESSDRLYMGLQYMFLY